jgi:hypothetical protein
MIAPCASFSNVTPEWRWQSGIAFFAIAAKRKTASDRPCPINTGTYPHEDDFGNPGRYFRRAKAKAAEQNVPLRQFVSEAVEEKLAAKPGSGEKARRKLAGNLRHLRSETGRINQSMDEEFEEIEPEE